MNYKAEANEIVEKFHRIITSQMFGEVDYIHSEIGYLKSKQCALICVDEKIKTLKEWEKYITRSGQIEDLKEIKTEVKNYDA